MVARKIRTSQAENGFSLGKRYVQGQQFSGEPQIDDAPVNGGKALLNVPTLHPAAINAYRSWSRDGGTPG